MIHRVRLCKDIFRLWSPHFLSSAGILSTTEIDVPLIQSDLEDLVGARHHLSYLVSNQQQ